MGEWMTDYCTIIRNEDDMQRTMERLHTWKERYDRVSLSDTGMWTNQNLSFTRALGDMLRYAEAILLGAIERKESRGSHYRPDYLERDDERFLKTTVAKYDAANDKPILEWEDVPQPMVAPRARTYGKTEDESEEHEEQQEQETETRT
jgi:succinate dehydrogenase / fumarate reductase flavoprotein subunit